MADENTLRLKLTVFQAKTLYKIIKAYPCSEIEDFTLTARIAKSIEEFLILKEGLSKDEIRTDLKKEPTEADFEQMLKDIDAGKFK